MTIGTRSASALLFLGDLVVFAFSLWATLFLRYGELPDKALLATHLPPFIFLFALWLIVFFVSGLYEKRVIFFRRDLSGRIIRTQILNIVLAALFFFLIPALGITPKTNLLIYLVVSLVLILSWRLAGYPVLAERRGQIEALVIATGPEEEELTRELNSNARYTIHCQESVNPSSMTPAAFAALLDERVKSDIELLIVDTKNPTLAPYVPELYRHIFERGSYQIVDLIALYEEVFDRVPLTLVNYEWFFRYASRRVSGLYLFLKRLIDIVGSILMGIVTAIITPFIWIAMKIESAGPLFIRQDRIGENETLMRAYKFRTMRFNKSSSSEWTTEEQHTNPVTRVGAFLRKTSLDEFPQFLNVLTGELSLIGPRNDIEGLGNRLAEALPYYRVRYIAKPGITGWAQVNQQYEPGNISPQSIEETKMRLAYDFYYLKHRSLMLDLVIALKTLKRMLFRVSNW